HCSSEPNLNDGSLGREILSKERESKEIESIDAQLLMMIKRKLNDAARINFKLIPFKTIV
ncbi:MAG: hypothetical protein RL229_577, partial [Pseudomonadota bacterium]